MLIISFSPRMLLKGAKLFEQKRERRGLPVAAKYDESCKFEQKRKLINLPNLIFDTVVGNLFQALVIHSLLNPKAQ